MSQEEDLVEMEAMVKLVPEAKTGPKEPTVPMGSGAKMVVAELTTQQSLQTETHRTLTE